MATIDDVVRSKSHVVVAATTEPDTTLRDHLRRRDFHAFPRPPAHSVGFDTRSGAAPGSDRPATWSHTSGGGISGPRGPPPHARTRKQSHTVQHGVRFRRAPGVQFREPSRDELVDLATTLHGCLRPALDGTPPKWSWTVNGSSVHLDPTGSPTSSLSSAAPTASPTVPPATAEPSVSPTASPVALIRPPHLRCRQAPQPRA